MKRWQHPAIFTALLVILGFGVYANTLGNKALFHHAPNPHSDPVLNNSLLRNSRLLPKIFTGEFLLTTYGEYRPLGYALFALIRGAAPREGFLIWHVLLIGIHVLSAILVFVMMRMLLRDTMALVLSAAYLLHPLFGPVVNDLNMIYFLWGLLFSVMTLWLFLVYMRTSKTLYLLLSILSFAASAFSYKHAIVVPAFLMALCLYHDRHPRAAATALVYLTLGSFVAGVLRVPPLMTLAGLAAVVGIAGAAGAATKDRYVALAKVLPPYLAIVALFLVVSATVPPRPLLAVILEELNGAGMIAPFQPWFVARRLLAGSLLHVMSLGIAALAPLLLVRWRGRHVAAAVALVFLAIVAVQGNRDYRDDVRYWRCMDKLAPEQPVIRLNMATAYVEDGEWEPAREILMGYFCEPPTTAVPFLATVQTKIGKTFAGMGNDRMAGHCFYSTQEWQWRWRCMKNLLNDVGDFSFRRGFLSAAECVWASALVTDRYDVRLYNNLGRVLVYKNFFQAASKYFHRALSLDPENPTALYYLAFIAELGDCEEERDLYTKRWRAATHSGREIDFQPIYDAYKFDRDKMRDWFSGNPTAALCRSSFVETYRGKTYSFWEVPLEKGKYLARHDDDAGAAMHLREAYDVNPQVEGNRPRAGRDLSAPGPNGRGGALGSPPEGYAG